MRDWQYELNSRVAYIQKQLEVSGARGILYGNSGGKDCTLVGILARKSTPNVLSVIMPSQSSCNYQMDREHAYKVAHQYDITTLEVDLSQVKKVFLDALNASGETDISSAAAMNINPRLRMTTLYALAQTRGYLVAGTGNRSEIAMGYYTKWGDGAYDLNPICDLTVTEIYDFLRYLNAPEEIILKAPSAGLFEGQTDEKELGITYAEIDRFLLYGEASAEVAQRVTSAMKRTEHKKHLNGYGQP